jgi:hypothetical protein
MISPLVCVSGYVSILGLSLSQQRLLLRGVESIESVEGVKGIKGVESVESEDQGQGAPVAP